MTDPTGTSPKRKPDQSSAPDPLTPPEIESLKQDAKDAGEKLHEMWKENPLNQKEDD